MPQVRASLFVRPHSRTLSSPTCIYSNTQPYVETADFVYPNYSEYMAGTRSVSLASPTADPSNGAEMVLDPSASSATATASGDAGQASALAQSRAAAISSGTQTAAKTASATGDKKTGAAVGGFDGALKNGATIVCGLAATVFLGAGLVVF